MKNGIEVFDFRDEDELPECAAADYLRKFQNPSTDNSATPKFEFLGDRGFGHKEGGSGLLVFSQTKPTTSQQQNDFDQDNHVPRNFCPEFESRDSCPEEFTNWNSQLNSALSNSQSSYESADDASDADESMGKSPLSSPGFHGTEDDATFTELEASVGGYMPDNCHGNVVLDNVNKTVSIYPDFVYYCGNCCVGSAVIFSHDGIRIESSITCDDGGTSGFQKGINDIVEIVCQRSQKAGCILVKLQVLSEDTVEGGNTGGASGDEEIEFSVYEPNWPEKQEAITSLNIKFSSIWQEVGIDGHDSHKCYFPNFDEPFEEVIYPKEDSDAVAISKRDVDLLLPETYINDTIIDFYIKYLKNQILPEDRQKFHFFNSFFFRKLADLDKDPSSINDGRAAYLRVHKWTRKVDLFGKDYIFIPVNFNLHWSLIVLCHPGEVAGFKDEDIEMSPKVPCILHMDSIRGTHAGLKNLVQSYLWEEWKGRHKDTSEDLSSRFLNLRFVSLELPQQENSFDCGLFLLHYLELFLAEAPTSFDPFKITKYSNFLNEDWFLPAEAYLKRTLIQKLIFELLETRNQQIMSTGCNDEQDSPEQNGTVTGIEFVSEIGPAETTCHGNLANSQAGHGIEMTLLEPSSTRKLHSDNDDSSMVLKDLLQPGDASRTLLGQFQSFDHPSSYYHLNGAILPREQEDGAGFTYMASGESNFQQLTETTAEPCSLPYPSGAFMMDTSWNPGISIQEECNANTFAETSCGSDDDDVGIIEVRPGVDMELGEKEHMDQQRSPLLEMVGCVTEDHVLASCNLAMAIGANAYRNDNEEDGDLRHIPSYEDHSTLSLQRDPGCTMYQLDPDSEKEMGVLTCGTEASEDADGMQNGYGDRNLLPSEDNSAMLQQTRLGVDSEGEMVVLTRSTTPFEDADRMQNGIKEEGDFPPYEENLATVLRQDHSTAANQMGSDFGNKMVDLTLGSAVSDAVDGMRNGNEHGDLQPEDNRLLEMGPDSENMMVDLTLGTEASEAVNRIQNDNEEGDLPPPEDNRPLQMSPYSGNMMVDLTLGTEASEAVNRIQNDNEEGDLPPPEDNRPLQMNPDSGNMMVDLTMGIESSEAVNRVQNDNEEGDLLPPEENQPLQMGPDSGNIMVDWTLGTEAAEAVNRIQNDEEGELPPHEENRPLQLGPDFGNSMLDLTLGTEASEAANSIQNDNGEGDLLPPEDNRSLQMGSDSGNKMVDLTLGTEASEVVDMIQNDNEDGDFPPPEENRSLQMGLDSDNKMVDSTQRTDISEAVDTMQNGMENGDVPQSEENPTMLLQQDSSRAVNRLSQDSKVVVFTRRSKSFGKKDIPSSEENQTMSLEQDSGDKTEHQLDIATDLMANKEDPDDLMTTSESPQPAKRTHTMSLDEGSKDVISNGMQLIKDGLSAKYDEQQQAKKIRLMSPDKDLHQS